MSIASEIERLQSAKAELKSAIEARGVSVDAEDTIDAFASKISEISNTTKGQWSPAADTAVFSVSDLKFTPEFIYIVASISEENLPPNTIVSYVKAKENIGHLKFKTVNGEPGSLSILANTTAETWFNNGYTISIPSSNVYGYFKAGYTYNYFVSG